MSRTAPVPGEWWCWRCDEPATFRCRERSHDVRQHFATGGIVTAPVMPGGESTSAQLRQTQSALSASQADLTRVERERDQLREDLAAAEIERDDARALVASVARSNWIVARDGGRDCERCQHEIRRGEAYMVATGTSDVLAHVRCPDPAAHQPTEGSTDV